MMNQLKTIVFVVGAVMLFTAQSNRQEDKESASQGQRAQTAPRHAAPRQTVPRQTAPQPVTRREAPPRQAAPQQVNRRQGPSAPVRILQSQPRVYAIPAPQTVDNNRLLRRQHHNHWQPRYNFYDNQYHFYPYVNLGGLMELSGNVIPVLYEGQTYYYDLGTFYAQEGQQYLAVPPPLDVIVSALPPQARQVRINGQVYYRYKGVCYIQVPQGFQVVEQVGSASGDY